MPPSEPNKPQRNADNVTAQMRKGTLEFAILLVIAKRKTYANEIIECLQEAKLTVVEGTVYPLLSRLKNDGMLQYDWEESKAGPPRKYYSLTSDGEVFLNNYKDQWHNLEEAIHHLQNMK